MIRNRTCLKFKIAKRIVKNTQVVISEQCIVNYDSEGRK